jgi:hypothetical protein
MEFLKNIKIKRYKMKKTLKLIFIMAILPLLTKCSSNNEDNNFDNPQEGYVTGEAKDVAGRPLNGVKVLIDHSIFFNAGIHTNTNNDGKYQLKIPHGSWYAFATHEVVYNNKNYTFYLHPDNASGFGGEGAVRNFEWKLTGAMSPPLSGTYGGLVTIDNFPGVYIDETEIGFVFTPVGALVDGSEGTILTRHIDSSQNIEDVPIGRYIITATYQGNPLRFRRWNTEETFVESFEINFEPLIEAQCFNCIKLEYYWES